MPRARRTALTTAALATASMLTTSVATGAVPVGERLGGEPTTARTGTAPELPAANCTDPGRELTGEEAYLCLLYTSDAADE